MRMTPLVTWRSLWQPRRVPDPIRFGSKSGTLYIRIISHSRIMRFMMAWALSSTTTDYQGPLSLLVPHLLFIYIFFVRSLKICGLEGIFFGLVNNNSFIISYSLGSFLLCFLCFLKICIILRNCCCFFLL